MPSHFHSRRRIRPDPAGRNLSSSSGCASMSGRKTGNCSKYQVDQPLPSSQSNKGAYGGVSACQISSISATSRCHACARASLARRADTPTRNAPVSSLSRAQRPLASRRSSQLSTKFDELILDRRVPTLANDFRHPRGACCGSGRLRPEQCHRFRRVTNVVARQAKQLIIDAVGHQCLNCATNRKRKRQSVRQRRQRPATVRVRLAAQILGHQAKFRIASRCVGQSVQQFRKCFHNPPTRCLACGAQRLHTGCASVSRSCRMSRCPGTLHRGHPACTCSVPS